jgi:hypothetical protein
VKERITMKNLALASLTFLTALPLAPQSPKLSPMGMWQGTLDSLPGVTLSLSFQVKLGGDRTSFATVKVIFNADTKAQPRCLDCGSDSPTTELTKQID